MIPEKLTYLFVDFFTILFPFIFSFTDQFDFKKYWKYFFVVNIPVAILYICWDMTYTHLGVWGFHHHYTLGIDFFGLPIEEIFFFICTPFACLFTYYCFRKFIFPRIQISIQILWLILGCLFFIFGFVHLDKLYTSAAFISCALAYFIVYRMKQIPFFSFFLYYIIILIPFFIFNGILTGSFLDRIVVYYDNTENLGIRILTIPFEDIFYGMAMLLYIILGFEYLISRKENRK